MNSAIIVAAGSGNRMQSSISKQYLDLGGKSILERTLEVFAQSPLIQELIVVIGQGQQEIFNQYVSIKNLQQNQTLKVVEGGAQRVDSVLAGLEALHKDCTHVLIHDGVRPFVREQDIQEVLAGLEKAPGCITVVPVVDTVKVVNSSNLVEETLDRSKLRAVHTPQGFVKTELLQAYQEFRATFPEDNPTDDAYIMEKTGRQVAVVIGVRENIKITTPFDMAVAQVLLSNNSSNNNNVSNKGKE